MLLVDDLLLSPIRGILWIFREIHNAAREEMANEPESIAQQLRSLYMQLETDAISEQEFEQQEKRLLDRLDEIQGGGGSGEERESEEAIERGGPSGDGR
jgi:hypothetical protein